jgi:hypothetical protein
MTTVAASVATSDSLISNTSGTPNTSTTTANNVVNNNDDKNATKKKKNVSSDSEEDLDKDEEITEKKDKITRKRISNLKSKQCDVTLARIDRCNDDDSDSELDSSIRTAPSNAANQTAISLAKTLQQDSVDDKFKVGDAQEMKSKFQVNNSDIDQRACRKKYNDAFCRIYFDDYINLEPKPILRGEDSIHAQSNNKSVERPKGKAESKHADDKSIEDKYSAGSGQSDHKYEGKNVNKSGDDDIDKDRGRAGRDRDRDRKRSF